MAVVMSMCPVRSCTAVRAAFPTAAAVSMSTVFPVACSPARCRDVLLLFRCSQLLGFLCGLKCLFVRDFFLRGDSSFSQKDEENLHMASYK